MSGSYFYIPRGIAKHSLPCSAPSSFRELVKEIFGTMPICFSECDLPILKALAIYERHSGSGEEENTFEGIIKGVEKYKEIELDIQY